MRNLHITFLLIFIISVSTMAQNLLSVGNTVAMLGDTSSLDITLQNVTKINGLNFILEYDSDLIEVQSIESGSLLSSISDAMGNTFSNNLISFVAFDNVGSMLQPGFGSAFKIKFTVRDTTLVGDSTTQVSFYQATIVDSTSGVIPFTFQDGEISIIGLTSVVQDEKPVNLPGSFELRQNHPNPFNPSTTIPFAVPTASRVKLRLYNVLGQRVRKVIDEKVYKPGWHYQYLDLSDLSSGVYFFRLEAEPLDKRKAEFTKTRKLMLLK